MKTKPDKKRILMRANITLVISKDNGKMWRLATK